MPKKSDISELEQIGLNIRSLREKQELSRAQLAFEIETTEKQLSRIEGGEINSGILTYIKIARALNVSFKEILQGLKL